MELGVLALQGDFAAHGSVLARLGAGVREVRRVAELEGLAGLVIPGGESTTLLNLMRDEPWFEALRAFHAKGAALLGTCAGAIVLARSVTPHQPSLALVDCGVERNGYGRQVDSFESAVRVAAPLGEPLLALFIRAPRFSAIGAGVSVLGWLDAPGAAAARDEPVLLRQGRTLLATFHPELTGSFGLHRLFLADAADGAR